MNRVCVRFLIFLFLVSMIMATPLSAANAPAIEVGHVYYLEGELLRYVPEEQDWVAAVRDIPFTTGDAFYSADNGRAELIIPNGSWIRVGNITQIQFTGLSADLSEADVASGMARFYNKSDRTVIKATSPFGYVLANPGTVFDFYVGENSVEVVAIRGMVSFIHLATNARYDVTPGSPSVLADQNQVSSGEGTVDADWDRWNAARESFWAEKMRTRGRSAGYLPTALQPEAYALDENGAWETVPYQGRRCWFWRPTSVAAGWSPFTMGRWTDWYGDQTWVPEEPFGYVTHHYGNWVYTRDRWYWAPPVAGVSIGLPFLNIGFFWSPGRVSWIHSGGYAGWVPLAPNERYYGRRNWGDPHTVVVNNVNITRISMNVRNYAYADHAVVVPQSDFYGVRDYRSVRVANVNRAMIDSYRAAPVIDNTVVPNYTTNRQRYQYTNVPVKDKPHSAVINRIQHNETVIRGARKENAAVLQRQVKTIKQGKINREARIEQPRTTDYIVPVNEVNRPRSEIKLQQKEIKHPGAGVRPTQPAQVVVPRYVAPAAPGRAKQVVVPEHVAPAQPEHPNQAVVPEHVAPARPGRPGGQVTIPEHATPAKPAQKERPGQVVVPQHTATAKPGQPGQVTIPEHVLPARPSQPGPPGQVVIPQHTAPAAPGRSKQVVVPQHVAPAQPEHPNQAVVPERVAPARRGQPGQVMIPEHATPVKPAQKESPGQVVVPQHTAPARPDQAQKVVIPQHMAPVKPPSPPPPQVAPAKPSPPPPPQQVAPVKPSPPPAPAQPVHPPQPKPQVPPPPPQVAPVKPSPPPPPAQPVHPPQAKPQVPAPPQHQPPGKPGVPEEEQRK